MNGTAENEYMHESLEKDAVKYDLPPEEIITALAQDNKELKNEIDDLKRKILAHKKGDGYSVKCPKCKDIYWRLPEEPMVCPRCEPEKV